VEAYRVANEAAGATPPPELPQVPEFPQPEAPEVKEPEFAVGKPELPKPEEFEEFEKAVISAQMAVDHLGKSAEIAFVEKIGEGVRFMIDKVAEAGASALLESK
jgi:hypothetical protein